MKRTELFLFSLMILLPSLLVPAVGTAGLVHWLCGYRPGPEIVATVDMLEVNHILHPGSDRCNTQVIFWDFQEDGFYGVRDWLVVNNDFVPPSSPWIFRLDKQTVTVYYSSWYETRSDWDPEVADRKFLKESERKKIFGESIRRYLRPSSKEVGNAKL